MDVSEIIKKRRIIRTYKKQTLPQDIIEKLLEAARWAPSAGNVQPWAFVVASSQIIKQSLSLAAFGQKDLEEASVVIVVCVMKSVLNKATVHVVNHCFAFRILRLQFKTSC